MNKKLIFIIGVAVVAPAVVFILTRGPAAIEPEPIKPPPAGATDEIQYLIFFPDAENAFDVGTNKKAFKIIDVKVSKLIKRIGTVGDGKSHQLGFATLIPALIADKAAPGRIEMVIKESFNVAKKHNIAVYFSLLTHYMWPNRQDLWNFFDPDQPGYDPGNKVNVEWINWEGDPHTTNTGESYRYLDWGTPERLAPHMCYNSPKILSEVTRLTTKGVKSIY